MVKNPVHYLSDSAASSPVVLKVKQHFYIANITPRSTLPGVLKFVSAPSVGQIERLKDFLCRIGIYEKTLQKSKCERAMNAIIQPSGIKYP